MNKVILCGNLGKEPELRYTPSGAAVVTFSLATTERYKDRDGNRQEKTEWHNIVAWRNLAEICGKYLTKGKKILCEGKIQTRSYDDRDGNKRYITEIVIDQMEMLGGPGEGPGTGQGQGRQENAHQGAAQGQQRPNNPNYQGGGGGQASFQEPAFNPDDEIPFFVLHETRDLK